MLALQLSAMTMLSGLVKERQSVKIFTPNITTKSMPRQEVGCKYRLNRDASLGPYLPNIIPVVLWLSISLTDHLAGRYVHNEAAALTPPQNFVITKRT